MSDLSESQLVKSQHVTLKNGLYVYESGTDNEFVYQGNPITNKTSCKRHGVALTCSRWRTLDHQVRELAKEGFTSYNYSRGPELRILWEKFDERTETHKSYHRHGTVTYTVDLYRPSELFNALAADWPYWHRAEMCLDHAQIDPEEVEVESIASPRISLMDGANENPKFNAMVCTSCDDKTIKLSKGQLRALVGVTKECAKKQGVADSTNFNRLSMRSLLRKGYIVASVELDSAGNPTFGVKPTHDAAMHALLAGDV